MDACTPTVMPFLARAITENSILTILSLGGFLNDFTADRTSFLGRLAESAFFRHSAWDGSASDRAPQERSRFDMALHRHLRQTQEDLAYNGNWASGSEPTLVVIITVCFRCYVAAKTIAFPIESSTLILLHKMAGKVSPDVIPSSLVLIA